MSAWFRISGFGFRVAGVVIRDSGDGFRVVPRNPECQLENSQSTLWLSGTQALLPGEDKHDSKMLEPPIYMWGHMVCTRIQETTP